MHNKYKDSILSEFYFTNARTYFRINNHNRNYGSGRSNISCSGGPTLNIAAFQKFCVKTKSLDPREREGCQKYSLDPPLFSVFFISSPILWFPHFRTDKFPRILFYFMNLTNRLQFLNNIKEKNWLDFPYFSSNLGNIPQPEKVFPFF